MTPFSSFVIDFTTWPTNAHDYCSGTRQSPINIVTSKVEANSKLTPFTFTGFDDNSTFFSIGNTGDSGELHTGKCNFHKIFLLFQILLFDHKKDLKNDGVPKHLCLKTTLGIHF